MNLACPQRSLSSGGAATGGTFRSRLGEMASETAIELEEGRVLTSPRLQGGGVSLGGGGGNRVEWQSVRGRSGGRTSGGAPTVRCMYSSSCQARLTRSTDDSDSEREHGIVVLPVAVKKDPATMMEQKKKQEQRLSRDEEPTSTMKESTQQPPRGRRPGQLHGKKPPPRQQQQYNKERREKSERQQLQKPPTRRQQHRHKERPKKLEVQLQRQHPATTKGETFPTGRSSTIQLNRHSSGDSSAACSSQAATMRAANLPSSQRTPPRPPPPASKARRVGDDDGGRRRKSSSSKSAAAAPAPAPAPPLLSKGAPLSVECPHRDAVPARAVAEFLRSYVPRDLEPSLSVEALLGEFNRKEEEARARAGGGGGEGKAKKKSWWATFGGSSNRSISSGATRSSSGGGGAAEEASCSSETFKTARRRQQRSSDLDDIAETSFEHNCCPPNEETVGMAELPQHAHSTVVEGDSGYNNHGYDGNGNRKGRRVVRFSSSKNDNSFRRTLSRRDMSRSELRATWYDQSDRVRMQADVVSTIVAAEIMAAAGLPPLPNEDEDDDGDNFDFGGNHHESMARQGSIGSLLIPGEDHRCSRGIEHLLTSEAYECRERAQRKVRKAVLDEQEAQRRQWVAANSHQPTAPVTDAYIGGDGRERRMIPWDVGYIQLFSSLSSKKCRVKARAMGRMDAQRAKMIEKDEREREQRERERIRCWLFEAGAAKN